MCKPLVIGVTGGSGCGKSTLGALLSERFGARFLDADAIYHEMLRTDAPLRAALAEAFGAELLREDGIDRRALAARVFDHPAELDRLNAITHPRVCARIRWELAKATNKIVCIDAFGLFESGLDALCDRTVGVLASREARIARITARDHIAPEAAAARVDAQQPEAFYRARCTDLLENNGTEAEFTAACVALCENLVKKDGNCHV